MEYKKEFFLLIISIIFTLVIFEISLLFTDGYTKSLKDSLYYQGEDVEVYRVSNNSDRLYELLPSSSKVYNDVHKKEKKYSSRKVSINSLGFRDKERNKTKPEGIFRIVILGGSNTYGALVSDNDTYPAIMQKILDDNFPNKFEVWNAGLSAYVMSQKVAYADYIIEEFNPDLLIFQVGNTGRRAFLENKDFTRLFKKNKELYLENIPFLFYNFSNNSSLMKIHYSFVSNSRFYGFIITMFNSRIIGDINPSDEKGSEIKSNYTKIKNKYDYYGDIVNRRDFNNFLNNHNNLSIIIFDPNAKLYCNPENYREYEEIGYFSLCSENIFKEYREIHPPSYVYEWYAEELVKMLQDEGYINITK